MVIDQRAGSAELDRLAEQLAAPCRVGDYVLDGLITKTSTALIFVGRGPAFGSGDGVLKLTGQEFAPLLQRELGFLNLCQGAEITSVVRPVRPELEWLELQPGQRVAAILLPFLAGGDLVQWIGARVSRSGRPGAYAALEIGEHVGGVLRALLRLPRLVVHGDVKAHNVLLPAPDAPLTQLTLIDMDASAQLDVGLEELATVPREMAQCLLGDVAGFGELLYEVATGREPPAEGPPDPRTGNPAFDRLVVKCLTSDAGGPGYATMADDVLWRDLEQARTLERAHERRRAWTSLLVRPVLAALGVLLFIALVFATLARLGNA